MAAATSPPLLAVADPKSERLLDVTSLAFDNAGVAPGQPPLPTSAFAAQVTLTVLVSVALFMLFILAFFFLLTRNVEKKVVSTSVARVVQDLAAQAKLVLTPEENAKLGAAVAGLQPPDTAAADAAVAASNAALTRKAGIVVGAVVVVVIIVAAGVLVGMRQAAAKAGSAAGYPDPVKVCLSATMGFAAVAVCEVVFLNVVAAQYRPLDTNATRADLLNALVAAVETQQGSTGAASSVPPLPPLPPLPPVVRP